MDTNSYLQDNFVRILINAVVVAAITSVVSAMTIQRTLSDRLIKLETRFEQISNQGIENKNRINENVKEIQKHEVQIELLKP